MASRTALGSIGAVLVAALLLSSVVLLIGDFSDRGIEPDALSVNTVRDTAVPAVPHTGSRSGQVTAASGPTWTNLTSTLGLTGSPPPRESGSMVWDSTDGYVLLFGGEETNKVPYRYFNDTWAFEDDHWVNLTRPDDAPSERFGAYMSDDPSDGVVVLFGGATSAGHADNDTWEFVGGTWTNVTRAVAPPRGFWGSMSYDTQTDTVILFGGGDFGVYSNETWSFHAGVWTELFPATSPVKQDDQSQVDDVADGYIMMFGGLNTSGYLNATWTYSDSTWTELSTPSAPSERAGQGMAYDSTSSLVVMYSGYDSDSSTWVYQAGTWTSYSLSVAPPLFNLWGQMADDPADGGALAFEGDGIFNGTWLFTDGSSTSPPPISATLSAQPSTFDLGQSTVLDTTVVDATAPLTFAYSTLPPGCSSANVSELSCTPTASGSYWVGVNVTQSSGGTAAATTEFTVVSTSLSTLSVALNPVPSHLVLGKGTSLFANASGGDTPYEYRYSGLPTGCSSTDSAVLPCTPSATGTFDVTVNVTDPGGQNASATASIVVNASGSSPGSGSSSGSSSSSLWPWIGVGLAVIVAIILLLLVINRRRRKPASPPGSAPPVG